MIDLPVAMKRAVLIILFFIGLAYFPAQAQEEMQLSISSPTDGQILQGLVTITGSVAALGFSSYELSFAYEDDPTQTWFPLASGTTPVSEGDLGTWDTSTLTDGNYTLRLQIYFLDGTTQETTVTGLRVRNYTPIPTATFTITATAIVQFAAPTAQRILPAPATATPSLPTPTGFPPNPAGLQEASIPHALGWGAILALVLFVVFGLLLRLRRE